MPSRTSSSTRPISYASTTTARGPPGSGRVGTRSTSGSRGRRPSCGSRWSPKSGDRPERRGRARRRGGAAEGEAARILRAAPEPHPRARIDRRRLCPVGAHRALRHHEPAVLRAPLERVRISGGPLGPWRAPAPRPHELPRVRARLRGRSAGRHRAWRGHGGTPRAPGLSRSVGRVPLRDPDRRACSAVHVILLVSIFPILLNTLTGIEGTDRHLIEAARSFGARPMQIFAKVMFPSALPVIVTGLRLGLARGLVGVVVAELFGAKAGLGYLILYSAQTFDMAALFAGVLILAVAGVVSSEALKALERRLAPWRFVEVER
ncbi:MAG: ABC transporter permease subunit [Chloroflexi bacterium]|nr:MAG: ABC transporter permease subunit [Chloroflexota bacterium]